MPETVIVGGGLSGLALAHTLLHRDGVTPDAVRVLEAGPRTGGYLGTTLRDGYLVEWAANGFLDDAPATLDLLARAGLADDLVRAPAGAAARRHIVWRGGLEPVPASPPALLATRLLTLRGKLRLLREPWVHPGEGEESVAAFAERRLGPETVPLADAFVTGVFAGDAASLSLDHAFPRLRALERAHGSLLRGLRAAARPRGAPRAGLASLRGGMGSLAARLAQQVPVETGAAVTAVRPRDGGGFEVDLQGRRPIEAARVVLALPPARAARLLGADLPPQREAPLAVVALGFPVSALLRDLGFGFLAPAREGRFVLGVVAESTLFPERAPGGHVLLRALVGGTRDPARAALPDEALLAGVLEDLRALGVVHGGPTFSHVVRHAGGIPQLDVGHGALLEAVARLEAAYPGLHFAGAGYRGVAVNALVAEAASLAARLAPGRVPAAPAQP